MLKATRQALDLSKDRSRKDFDSDPALQLALWKLLEIIGEAATRVSPALQARHTEIPWRDAMNTRHRLTHGYDTVDYEIIWSTVRDDLPSLLTSLQALAAELADEAGSVS